LQLTRGRGPCILDKGTSEFKADAVEARSIAWIACAFDLDEVMA
jgi:hypothetical protein